MAFTDYHKRVRDKIVLAVEQLALGVPTVALNDPTDAARVADLPAIVAACVGPEQRREEMATNRRSGIGYPVALALMGLGVPDGERAPILDETLFRRVVEQTFHLKRLDGVDEIGWCEVYADGIVYDKDEPHFQRLNTMLTVVAVGRFTR